MDSFLGLSGDRTACRTQRGRQKISPKNRVTPRQRAPVQTAGHISNCLTHQDTNRMTSSARPPHAQSLTGQQPRAHADGFWLATASHASGVHQAYLDNGRGHRRGSRRGPRRRDAAPEERRPPCRRRNERHDGCCYRARGKEVGDKETRRVGQPLHPTERQRPQLRNKKSKSPQMPSRAGGELLTSRQGEPEEK